MVNLSASAVSIAFFLSFWFVLIHYDEESIAMQIDNEAVFITARFQYQRPHERTTIVWVEPSSISLTTHISLHNEIAVLKKTWRTTAVESQQMQTLLGEVSGLSLRVGLDFVLSLEQPGGIRTQLAWDPATETEQLQRIRNSFEKLSHLQYTEALAALASGRNFLEKGKLKDAIDAFRIGIEALGDRYESLAVIDDTGAKLVLAEHNLSTGKVAEAAALFDRVLEGRILVYRDQFKPEPWKERIDQLDAAERGHPLAAHGSRGKVVPGTTFSDSVL